MSKALRLRIVQIVQIVNEILSPDFVFLSVETAADVKLGETSRVLTILTTSANARKRYTESFFPLTSLERDYCMNWEYVYERPIQLRWY